jgi:hypothetical protein
MTCSTESKSQISLGIQAIYYPSIGIERDNSFCPGSLLLIPLANDPSAIDGRVKVWDFEQKACVATQMESNTTIWSAKWLRTTDGFITAGADRALYWYIAAGV